MKKIGLNNCYIKILLVCCLVAVLFMPVGLIATDDTGEKCTEAFKKCMNRQIGMTDRDKLIYCFNGFLFCIKYC